MKVAFLVTGSGGSFYCSNCYRDMFYFRAVKQFGNADAEAIPLYLPPENIYVESGFDTEVFFGAVSLYLREKIPAFTRLPAFIDKIFDSKPLLKIASRSAGSTRSAGLEEMTLNMIDGSSEKHKKELERLVRHLREEVKPDIIHLSNSLIIGLARQIKNNIDVKVVCSLQNEDDWLNDMAEPYRSKAWRMIADESENVDIFITPSKYFKNFFISNTGISTDKIIVIPAGTDPAPALPQTVKPEEPTIGFFSRVSYNNGFDKLVDAFIRIKKETEFGNLKMQVCGGYTGDDKPFIREQIEKLRRYGFNDSVTICRGFHGMEKYRFLGSVDLISVPVRKPDAYGLYIIEANSAGIPVVQPATGAFPEILEITGGGILYEPDTVEKLAESIVYLLQDKDVRKKYGITGMNNVRENFSMEKLSYALMKVYGSVCNK